MTAATDALYLIFTDLDGSLLDHHELQFRWEPASPAACRY